MGIYILASHWYPPWEEWLAPDSSSLQTSLKHLLSSFECRGGPGGLICLPEHPSSEESPHLLHGPSDIRGVILSVASLDPTGAPFSAVCNDFHLRMMWD